MPSNEPFRYPRTALLWDEVRALGGFAITAGPALALDLPWPALAVLCPLAVLFAAFGMQTLARRRLGVRLGDEAIEIEPGARRLAIDRIEYVSLAYFSVRRDGERGWFELDLRAPGERLRVDSRLEGFTDLVALAAQVATDRSLLLDRATLENFQAQGCRVEAPGRE